MIRTESRSGRRSSRAGSLRALFVRRPSIPCRRPSKLCKLVAKRNWEGLSNYLQTQGGREEVQKNHTKVAVSKVDPFLHTICCLHPPVSAVKDMVYACSPGIISARNHLNQTPLHVAAEHGAAPQVIEYLVELYPAAASMQDCNGKTPLHLHCEHCCFPESCDSGRDFDRLIQGPLRSVIRILIHVGISAVNVQDCQLATPLEYCIRFGADPTTIRYLQLASAKAWKQEAARRKPEKALRRTSSSSELSSGPKQRRFSLLTRAPSLPDRLTSTKQ